MYFKGVVIGVILAIVFVSGSKLGHLECSEKDGLKPDSKLLNLIVSKCQPKQGQSEEMTAACLFKCLMKQQKAVDKKSGQLKAKEASAVIDIFPEQFKANITARFDTCIAENNSKLKKEANNCASWIPFTKCFYTFGRGLCPSEKERKKMEEEALTSTTPAAEGDTTTE